MAISIDWWIAKLRELGAKNVDPYEQKLRSFGQNEQKVFEFIAEARAALLFLRNGISVAMQDKPDLRLELGNEIIYAEVKHQNEKETDRRDEAAIALAGPYEFVQVGNVFDDEQQHGWQGMCATAIKKQLQYVEGARFRLAGLVPKDALRPVKVGLSFIPGTSPKGNRAKKISPGRIHCFAVFERIDILAGVL